MDGSLFNTEAYHAEALLMIGHQHNIRPPHDPQAVHDLMMGKADYLVFEIVKSWEGFPPEWTVKDFVDEKNNNLLNLLMKVSPEAFFPKETLEMLKIAKAQDLYLALVTSSEKVITEKLLKMAGVYEIFNLILTRDDCPKHKPDPWPYLKAMEISKMSADECLIFEDSNVGLAAATASGAHVVKVEWF